LYTDERETTLVEQNQTASNSELDASLNIPILHSSDIENFDTSTQSLAKTGYQTTQTHKNWIPNYTNS
jgi:hypothetical protein